MAGPAPRFAQALLAVLALPVNVAITVPVLILLAARPAGAAFALAGAPWLLAAGALLAALGLGLFLWTVTAFWRIGRGTLAPWAPPRHLVLAGPYRHSRHPMITGVICVLAGEACLFGAWPLAAWAGAFLAANAVYLPLKEEPDLVARFGGAYARYMANVPRWLPRRSPWEGTP
ncbi:isoprenylcysteine carboxylmethyltransferase family protein [Paralimibaculum aggregatum]|uniref:Isoprenylcysteine carboxylmethyltransferase family protein n=1 Tax=Paralimibaculum aggregatum TaxID=3036245 RepID=A0ABQ6LMR2_9RHOB|nr:isoprenylcysteine carboxylmethyltransferase family protein [Limibaculum sp. NKW23]GMG83756.1 isoprenylcysteine carboxylmethyltransferase family protein [Limibaculum sp. NKW23]